MPTRWLVAALVLVLPATPPSAAPAEPAAWRSTLAAGPAAFSCADAGASQRVSSAIEQAVADMSFVLRPFARSRLTAGNRVFSRLLVRQEGADLVVERDGNPVRSPLDGTAAQWISPAGDAYQVSQVIEGAVLVQRFAAAGLERRNELTLSADGTGLSLEVVVRSERLPAPLAYQVTYRREP